LGIIWENRHYGGGQREAYDKLSKALYENNNGGKLCFQ